MRHKVLFLLLVWVLPISCSRSSGTIGQASEVNPPSASPAPCVGGTATALQLREGLGSATSEIAPSTLTDSFSKTLYVAELDSCGNFLSNPSDVTWALNNLTYGYLSTTSGSTADLYLNKNATTTGQTVDVTVTKASPSLTKTVSFQVAWTPKNIANLIRWYRVDSYMPSTSDGALVGNQGVSDLPDYQNVGTAYNAYSVNAAPPTDRRPSFNTSLFGKSVLVFCGSTTGCSGVTANTHLRTASSYADYAGTDLTIFFVGARANANKQYYFVNQSNGNNTGTFLGFTSNTTFRFGITGPAGGSNFVQATVSGYAAPPALEIWTGRLETADPMSALKGLRLFRNGAQVASNSAVISQQATATTIPYLGTQRNDNNNSQFYLGEFLVYNRALTSTELCQVHTFLNNKFSLGISNPCP